MNAPRRRDFTWMTPGTKEHQDFYARFAKAAYGRDDVIIPQGYSIDEDLSNRNRRVYFNQDTKHVIIANRGTDPKNASDLRVDAMLAAGITNQSRFRDAIKHASATRDKYGSEVTYTAVGHSMGGSISQEINRQTGIPVVAFSAHQPFRNLRNMPALSKILNWANRGNRKDVTNYATALDPIAVFQNVSGNTDHFVPQKSWDPHGLSNFIVNNTSVEPA
jgi:hypothetical protein